MSGDKRWALIDDKFHRLKPKSRRSLCDLAAQDPRQWTAAEVLRELSVGHQPVCAKCDRVANASSEPGARITPRKVLTPEQQAIRDRLDAERRQRENFRHEQARMQRERSSSVRTVSGGLPSLGKKRK
jgi:hypothetical protein